MKSRFWVCLLPLLFALTCISANEDQTPSPANKLLVRTVASSVDAFAFCSDGQVRVEYRISELQPHIRFGTWKMDGDSIRIRWTQEKGGEPVGPPVSCGSVCVYKQYNKFQRDIDQTEELSWNEIKQNQHQHWDIQSFAGNCNAMP